MTTEQQTSAGDVAVPPADRLYNLAPCGLMTTDEHGVIARVNATFSAWSGFAEDELVGQVFGDLLEPGARIFYETRFQPVLRLQGEVREVSLSLRRADQSAIPILVNAAADPDIEGLVHHAIFDATERQGYERQLLQQRRTAEESEARSRALQSASAIFASCNTKDELAHAVAECAKDALAAAAIAVFLHDGGELRLAGGSVPLDAALLPGGMPAAFLEPDATLSVSVRDADSDPATVAALRSAGMEALTAVPLVDGDRVIGRVIAYFRRTPELPEALLELQQALSRQAAQTLARIDLQTQLAAFALYDPLTGLANRALLRSHVTESVALSAQLDQPLSLIFVDLDDFKSINDELDHAAGDAVLRVVGTRLSDAVRAGDLVCRYGGDEFIIVCRNTEEDAAAMIGERIRASIREPISYEGWTRVITASVGVTVHSPRSVPLRDGPDLLRVADRAMYRSKDDGKDRVTIIAL